METYERQIKEIDDELARTRERTKKMNLQKKELQKNMYDYATRLGLTEYKGKDIEKILPKSSSSVKRRPKKEVTNDTLTLLRNIGVPDPGDLLKKMDELKKKPND